MVEQKGRVQKQQGSTEANQYRNGTKGREISCEARTWRISTVSNELKLNDEN